MINSDPHIRCDGNGSPSLPTLIEKKTCRPAGAQCAPASSYQVYAYSSWARAGGWAEEEDEEERVASPGSGLLSCVEAAYSTTRPTRLEITFIGTCAKRHGDAE